MCKARLGAMFLTALSACASATADEAPQAYSLEQQALEVTATWTGDASECGNVDADAVVQTRGNDVTQVPFDFHTIAPDDPNTGHPGCNAGYVVDFKLPMGVDNKNPGWHWLWMHAAPYPSEAPCEPRWHNQKVYAYWTDEEGEQRQRQLGETSWTWEDICSREEKDQITNLPYYMVPDLFERIRIVTQMGSGDRAGLGQYVYLAPDVIADLPVDE